MKKNTLVFSLTAMIATILIVSCAADAENEEEAVKKVIEEAYVKGVQIESDIDEIRRGFHPSFIMFVYKDGKMEKRTLDEWIERIEEGEKKDPGPPEYEITHNFLMVDVTGRAAVACIEIFEGGKHIWTDYLSLYKFGDGWKIVGKIYHRHS